MKSFTPKKAIFFLVLWSLLCSSTIVFAFHKTIDSEEINIGGITIGASLDYVEQIYGKPTNKKPFTNDLGSGLIYNYNDLFIVSGINTQDGKTYVDSIICREGILTTPSGFAVGSPYQKVVDKYGKVAPLSKERVRNYKKDFMYYQHSYGNWYMLFVVDKKDLIQEIQIFMDT